MDKCNMELLLFCLSFLIQDVDPALCCSCFHWEWSLRGIWHEGPPYGNLGLAASYPQVTQQVLKDEEEVGPG